eukprot:4849319-Prymnesium_polylepis.1
MPPVSWRFAFWQALELEFAASLSTNLLVLLVGGSLLVEAMVEGSLICAKLRTLPPGARQQPCNADEVHMEVVEQAEASAPSASGQRAVTSDLSASADT